MVRFDPVTVKTGRRYKKSYKQHGTFRKATSCKKIYPS
jgi:hypothetical protein